MLQRARLAMQENYSGRKLGGDVDVDESFIGGKARNMPRWKNAPRESTIADRKAKAIVAGVLQRGGKLRATVMSNRKKKSLQALVGWSPGLRQTVKTLLTG